MAAEDYKVDVSLTSACGQELAELQCAKEQQGVDATVHLSTVLLCLEAGLREEKVKVTNKKQTNQNKTNKKLTSCYSHYNDQVGGRCVAEMQEIRRSLMEDFSVTPELVTSCQVHKNQMKSCNKMLSSTENYSPLSRLRSRNATRILRTKSIQGKQSTA